MINIGILGAGKMGMTHAGLIQGNKDLKLIALCKKRKDRLEELKEKYHVEVFLDVDKFLSLKEMNYVVISTTNEAHEEMAARSMEKGKNVIVEKPMSTSYESTQRMISAFNKFKKKLLVFHNRRWDRDYLMVKDIIKSGKIGKILLIQSKILLCDEGWPYGGSMGGKSPGG
jgi:predicted dehydrogenase